MTPSNHEPSAGGSLRRPSRLSATARIACAAAAVFGGLNVVGALVSGSFGVLDALAFATVGAGVAGVLGYRTGAVWTFGTMSIYLVSLLAIGVVIRTGQAVTYSAPDWLVVDYRIVLLCAAAWCAACLVALFFGLRWQPWEGSSGTK